MFDNLRNAFREAIDNFNKELNRDQVPEVVDKLLRGMREEVTEAKTRLHDLEAAIQRAKAEARREEKEMATCERRAEMAEKIGDTETVQVAREYHARHAERKAVLDKKAAALEEELAVRKADIEEMLDKIREARKQRDALAATAGRESARESIRSSNDLFDELDRMAEVIGDEDDRQAAAREVEDAMGTDRGDDWDDLSIDVNAPTRRPVDVDARLEELKRRMEER